MSTFVNRRQVELVSKLLQSCAAGEHATCSSPSDCQTTLDEIEAVKGQIEAAARYDNFVPYHQHEKSEPNVTWPFAALIRCIEVLIVQPPWGEGAFRRSVWLTSALARLGEKGLYADAVLRTCVAPTLKRRLSVHIATAWHVYDSQQLPLETFPYQLRPWLKQFGSTMEPRLEVGRVPSLEEALVHAATGSFGALIDEWIAKTAAAHIIDWRLEDALSVEVLPTDTVIPGGAAATQWIFDRFSKTYFDDWHAESLSWELSFAQSPDLTAAKVGIDLSILQERPTATLLVTEALVRRHTGKRPVGSSYFAGVNVGEIQDQIVFLATSGDINQAQDLARAAAEKVPHEVALRNAYAFTFIPFEPAKARLILEKDRDAASNEILTDINVLSCFAAAGETEEALEILGRLLGAADLPLEAWLWSPSYLLSKTASPVIQYYYKVSEWVTEASAAFEYLPKSV